MQQLPDDPDALTHVRWKNRMDPETQQALYRTAWEMEEGAEEGRDDLLSPEWRAIIGMRTGDGQVVKDLKPHFFDQANDRKVQASEAIDALEHYLHITPIRYNERGEPSVQYIGRYATVAYNPETGVLVTTWPTGTQRRNKYGGGT